jgi:hypothetical protein
MTAGGPDEPRPYYGVARIAGGLVLLIVAALLAVIDSFSTEYDADSITLGLLLGTGSVLLGVEAFGRRINGGP